MSIDTKNSLLSQTRLAAWPFTSYYNEINRDVKWHSSWARHYWNQGGIAGKCLAAWELVPISLLLVPVVNVVTHIALSILFPSDCNPLFKSCLEQNNPTGAYVLAERGADNSLKSKEGKTLLQLFAEKGQANQCFVKQDLDICAALLEKKVPADFSHEGFKLMLNEALAQKHHALALALMEVEVEADGYPRLPSKGRKEHSFMPGVIAHRGHIPSFPSLDAKADELIRIYEQKEKASPLILESSPGESKFLIKALIRKIATESVPQTIQQKTVKKIDLGDLNSFSTINEIKYFFKQLSKRKSGELPPLFYFYNFDIFAKSNKTGHAVILDYLKQYASSGRAIFSMTPSVYEKISSSNPWIKKNFSSVKTAPISADEALCYLTHEKKGLEAYHGVSITTEAVETAITLSRYVPGSTLSKTPYEILDKAAALFKQQENLGSIELQEAQKKRRELQFQLDLIKLKQNSSPDDSQKKFEKELEDINKIIGQLERKRDKIIFLRTLPKPFNEKAKELIEKIQGGLETKVGRELIFRAASEKANIPLEQIQGQEAEFFLTLDKRLAEDVVGQESAVKETADAILRARAGLRDESRPQAIFLYAGPTGVGKTELAKSLARNLFGDEKKMIRFDMSEYQDKHSTNRLIGSPPGFVGYESGGQLTKALQENPYSVVLLDEIEKAAPEILTLLLQVFDDGRITDGKGNTVDCSQAIFIMTTNLGSRKLLENGQHFWFSRQTSAQIIEEAISASSHFPPELIGRIDAIIPFLPLTNLNVIGKIAEKKLKEVQKRLKERHAIDFSWSDRVISKLAEGVSCQHLGARPLNRFIDRVIQTELARKIAKNEFKQGDHISLGHDGNGYYCEKNSRN